MQYLLVLLGISFSSWCHAAYQEEKGRCIDSLMSNCIRQRPHAQKSVIRELKAFHVAGVPVDLRDERGKTALMTCAALGNVPLVAQWLLEHGADPTCKDKKGRTPLAIALGSGRKSGSIAPLLSAHKSMPLYGNEPACINGKVTNYLDGALHSKLKDCHKGRVVKNLLLSGGRWTERKQIFDSLKSRAIKKTLAQLYSFEGLCAMRNFDFQSILDSMGYEGLRDQSIYEWQQKSEVYLTRWLPDGNGRFCTNKHRDIIRAYLTGWNDDDYDEFIMDVAKSYNKSKNNLIALVKKYPVLRQQQMSSLTMLCALIHPKWIGPLKDAGVPIDQQYTQTCHSETALITSCSWGAHEFVETLLDHKARIDIIDTTGQDALLHALYQARSDTYYCNSVHTLLRDPRIPDIINRKLHVRAGDDVDEKSYLSEAMCMHDKHERDTVIAQLLHLGAHVGQLELDQAVACARDLSPLLPQSSLDDVVACYQKFLATKWEESWFFDVRSEREHFMNQAVTSANKVFNQALKPWMIPELADIVGEYMGLPVLQKCAAASDPRVQELIYIA